MPIKVSEAASLLPPSRYGIAGVAGYQDHNGNMYPVRVIGGSIDLPDGINGNVTIYRTPLVNYDDQNMVAWFEVVKHVIKDLVVKFKNYFIENQEYKDMIEDAVNPFKRSDKTRTKKAKNQVEVNDPLTDVLEKGIYDRLVFLSEYDLNKFITLVSWGPICDTLYTSFPKNALGHEAERLITSINPEDRTAFQKTVMGTSYRGEIFSCLAFSGGAKIPASMFLAKQLEIMIEPPHNTTTVATRIQYNFGMWQSLWRYVGLKPKGSSAMWEFFYKVMCKQDMRYTTIFDYINLIARDGNSPVSQLAEGITGLSKIEMENYLSNQNIMYMIMSMLLLKVWEYTRQSCDLPDCRFDTAITTFHRGMSDESFKNLMKMYLECWNQTQIRVPEGSLGHMSELKVLPIMYKGTDLKYSPAYDIWPHKRNNDSETYTGEPALAFSVIDFNDIEEIRPDQKKLEWSFADVRTLNDTLNNEVVSYNRITGEYDGVQSGQDQDCSVLIAIVYPATLKRIKADKPGQKMERRHWPLIYYKFKVVNSCITVKTQIENFLFNQKSIFGPNFYLFKSESLIESTPYDKTHDLVDLFGWGGKFE